MLWRHLEFNSQLVSSRKVSLVLSWNPLCCWGTLLLPLCNSFSPFPSWYDTARHTQPCPYSHHHEWISHFTPLEPDNPVMLLSTLLLPLCNSILIYHFCPFLFWYQTALSSLTSSHEWTGHFLPPNQHTPLLLLWSYKTGYAATGTRCQHLLMRLYTAIYITFVYCSNSISLVCNKSSSQICRAAKHESSRIILEN